MKLVLLGLHESIVLKPPILCIVLFLVWNLQKFTFLVWIHRPCIAHAAPNNSEPSLMPKQVLALLGSCAQFSSGLGLVGDVNSNPFLIKCM